MGLAFMGVMVGICCAACVPACGFFGARDRNPCMLGAYMIFNLFSLALGVYSVLGGINIGMALLGLIMPAFSTYYACKLRQKLSSPVQQQPLMPGQFTQAVMAQPVV